MVALDLLTPTKTRTFTFYDRCAILLDPDEMTSQRLRISVNIIGTPISRSINFKYPYNREFYGYAQSFWLNNLIHEFPINYTSQYIWDYWNEHATLAHQYTSALQKMSQFLSGAIDFMQFVLVQGSAIAVKLESSRPEVESLPKGGFLEEGFGIPFDNNPANDIVNTFVHPFDLIRFKFTFGTIFAVAIDSWNLGVTYSGSQPQPYPETPPYPTENPNGLPPFPTPGSRDPDNPYGQSPPDSDPFDPRLDPDDFSNAPPPTPVVTNCVRITGQVQIRNIDASPRTIDIVTAPLSGIESFGFDTETDTGGSYFVFNIRGAGGVVLNRVFDADLLGTATGAFVTCPPTP